MGQFEKSGWIPLVGVLATGCHIRNMPHRHPVLWAVAVAILLALVNSYVAAFYLQVSPSTRGALSIALLCVLVAGVILGMLQHRGRL